MLISHVALVDLSYALAEVNRQYDGNIRFKDGPTPVGHTRDGARKWCLTLTVNATSRKIVDSEKPRRVHVETLPGVVVRHASTFLVWGQLYDRPMKRISTACWHVHGYFMDALPSSAIIRIGREATPHRPGDPWLDFDRGSQAFPFMASEACECDE
jgi:hypothetical protein